MASSSQDTEITLGTTKLLFLFFGLVAICALFFALGYSLGRKAEPGITTASAAASPQITPGGSKPAGAGSAPAFGQGSMQVTADPTGLGAGTFTILRFHILGNVLGPVFIYASSLVSVGILLASGLSFLGLGVRPPTADWGLMLSTLRQSIYVNPVICALPGAAIFITSISFNLVSDGIRSAMDVRM